MAPQDTLTLSEASNYLAMDLQTLSQLAEERSIPSMSVDGQWVFSRKSIDKWRRLRGTREV
ncbi:MAG: helix-turn-helix domain-containing protein [Candidatus Methylomirabilia bacterium]